jgi:galactokinase
MAIERDMIMAVSTKPGESVIASTNAKYPPKMFTPDPNVSIDASVHEWTNYFLCGFKGVAQGLKTETMKPMQVVCDGSVPAVSRIAIKRSEILSYRV